MSNTNGQAVPANGTAMPATLVANEAVKDTKSVTAEQAQIAALQAQIAALRALAAKKQSLKFKLSETSSCISVYGLNRFPVSLRRSQWHRLIEAVPDLKAYMEKHAAEIELAEVKDAR